jgi:hypothetical protein
MKERTDIMGMGPDAFAILVVITVAGIGTSTVWSKFGASTGLLAIGYYVLVLLAFQGIESLWGDRVPEWTYVTVGWLLLALPIIVVYV